MSIMMGSLVQIKLSCGVV